MVTPTVGIYLKEPHNYFSEPEQEAVLAGWRHGKKWHFLEVYEAFNALTFIWILEGHNVCTSRSNCATCRVFILQGLLIENP